MDGSFGWTDRTREV